jgi:hypothetical protein
MTMDQTGADYALPLTYRYSQRLLKMREAAAKSGTFRERVAFSLFKRPPYAFGLLAAADLGKFFGFPRLSVIEFGVAEGRGLLDLCELALQVTAETGVGFDIYGFDRVAGLPRPIDYRDHPEIWAEGDFSMEDPQRLRAALPKNCQLLLGDIAETLPDFARSISSASPIGFVSVDVDIYRSTCDALRLFDYEPTKYLPALPIYFDDLYGRSGRISSLFRNAWSGQLLALKEFNASPRPRKIDVMHNLGLRFPMHRELWLRLMHVMHALDHPLRNRGDERSKTTVTEHTALRKYDWPFF